MISNKKTFRIIELIKQHPYLTAIILLCFLFCVVGVPIIINELYKYGQNNQSSYITKWEADDILVYWGSIITFFGTTILGIIALIQNLRISKINNELMRLQSQEYLPVLQASDFSISEIESNKGVNNNRSISKITIIETGQIRYILNIVDADCPLYSFKKRFNFSLENISNAKIRNINLTRVDYYIGRSGSINTMINHNSISTLLLPKLKTNLSLYFYFKDSLDMSDLSGHIKLKLYLEITNFDSSIYNESLDISIVQGRILDTVYDLESWI